MQRGSRNVRTGTALSCLLKSGKTLFCCPICDEVRPFATICNQLTVAIRHHVTKYERHEFMCDEISCRRRACIVDLVASCKGGGTACPNAPLCSGKLIELYSVSRLYSQLVYFKSLFDISYHFTNGPQLSIEHQTRLISSIPYETRLFLERQIHIIQAVINQSDFGIIQLKKLFSA